MESCKYFLATDNISSNKILIDQFTILKKNFQNKLTKSHFGSKKFFSKHTNKKSFKVKKNFGAKKFFLNILTKNHFGSRKKF